MPLGTLTSTTPDVEGASGRALAVVLVVVVVEIKDDRAVHSVQMRVRVV